MRTQVPVKRLVALTIAAISAAALFVFLNNRFGGPEFPPADPYELSSTFRDSQNIVKKSLVMYRGVKVGEVSGVEIEDGRAHVRFSVFDDYLPLREGTAAQIGHRTVFGEAIIVLYPGPDGGDELEDGTEVRSLYTVQPDEALQVFDQRTREGLADGAREISRGFASPNAPEQLSDTYAGGWATVTRLRRITDALHGREDELAGLVSSSAVVLGALSDHEGAISRIVGSAREVMEAVSAERDGLGESIDELHALLGEVREILPLARPLLEQGEELGDVGVRMARLLSPALIETAPLTRETRLVVESLEPANELAVPALNAATIAIRELKPVAAGLGPLFGNLIPILEWLQPRTGAITGALASGADSVDNGDSDGTWLRGFLSIEPRIGTLPPEGCDSPDGLCTNAYPAPTDALDPQPYEPGSYPELVPFDPLEGD